MKPQRSALMRILYACVYSRDGLISALKSEAAFRQELFLYIALLPALYFLPFTPVTKAVLLAANTIVLITELLNSSIEAVVDLVSPEHHKLAKKAKDTASAAVFLSLLLAAALWVCSLSAYFLS